MQYAILGLGYFLVVVVILLFVANISLATNGSNMDKMNGDDAAKEIRVGENECSGSKRIPIVAITGHIFEEEQEKIHSYGIDEVIGKPATQEKLL